MTVDKWAIDNARVLSIVNLKIKMRLKNIQVIAFDADDTLWHNESYFQEVGHKFCQLLEEYLPQHTVERELLKTEMDNISLYGYGIKAFVLSMIETAIRISDRTIRVNVIERIIELGKEMLDKPIEKLEGVEDVLTSLKKKLPARGCHQRRFTRPRKEIEEIRPRTFFSPHRNHVRER